MRHQNLKKTTTTKYKEQEETLTQSLQLQQWQQRHLWNETAENETIAFENIQKSNYLIARPKRSTKCSRNRTIFPQLFQ